MMEKRVGFEQEYLFNRKVLCSCGETVISYHKGRLFFQNGLKGKAILLSSLPLSGLQKIFSRIRILERLFRLEPRLAITIDSDSFFLTYNGSLYRITISTKQITHELSFRPGMNNLLGICKDEDGVFYFGEYFGNEKKEEVSIFRGRNGCWESVFVFPSQEITHIHNIIFDKYRDCFWVLTGDSDKESGIWRANRDFSSVSPVFRGKQIYRSCFLLPTKTGLLYATDSPIVTNSIMFCRELADGSWCEPDKLFSIAGPCIYGIAVDEQNVVLSTSVEPDVSLSIIRYRITRKLGKGVCDYCSHIYWGSVEKGFTEINRQKKDMWGMWLFQFGNVLFPSVLCSEGIVCTGQAVKRTDCCSFLLKY